MTDRPGSAFEVEAASVEEFLLLLGGRESAGASRRETRDADRRAVFIAQPIERSGSGFGYPKVRRYVVAAFAYGGDRISYRRTTSNAVQLPGTAEQSRDRQQRMHQETWAEFERGVQEAGLNVPIREGYLCRPADE